MEAAVSSTPTQNLSVGFAEPSVQLQACIPLGNFLLSLFKEVLQEGPSYSIAADTCDVACVQHSCTLGIWSRK